VAGEMFESDVTRESYSLHFAIADALGGKVRPFDMYQGPYVVIGNDVRIGIEPYAYCPPGTATRLWLCSEDGCGGAVYNEANDKQSKPFPFDIPGAEQIAVEMARSVL
jgi:hypothetical protein